MSKSRPIPAGMGLLALQPDLRASGLVIVYLGPDWMLEELRPEAASAALPPSETQLAFPV